MLNAEQDGQNFAVILNSPELNEHRFEFIEAILTPKQILNNTSVLQKYLNDGNIRSENKQQCLNVLVNNSTIIEDYFTHFNGYRRQGDFIGTLFEPREELDGESYFDRIENKQSIRNGFWVGGDQSLSVRYWWVYAIINANDRQPLLIQYLADPEIKRDDKLQCLNGLNSYTETQDLLRLVPLEPELAVIQTLFEQQNDGLNNQLPLDQYLNDVNILVKNKARTLNSIFTIIGRINEEDEVRINMLNNLTNTLTRQSFVTNFNEGNCQEQQLAIENAALPENAENAGNIENAENAENEENEEHLQDRKTTFLHIMMDPRYDPEYNENLNITNDINRKEVIQKIGQICPELLLDARDQLGNTVLNQTILLPYPSTIQQEEEVGGEQAAQVNREMEERRNQQVCQKLLHYDDYIKFQLMYLLIDSNTDILYPRIPQIRREREIALRNGNLENHEENGQVPVVGEQPEQQVRGNANQENNGNQQNHINQQNQGENGQVLVVNEQVEVQAEPEVQERRRPRGGLERMGGANGLQGNQVGGRNGNNRGNGIVRIND